MPLLHNYLFDELLIPIMYAFFLVSGIVGLALGIALAVFRTRVFRLFKPMNRWVSARKQLRPMEVQHTIEPFVYGHRRWFSVLFIVGGLFSILMLMANAHAITVASLFGAGHVSDLESLTMHMVGALLIVGGILSIAIGVLLGFFPDKLRALEKHSNRWISSRQMAKGVDDAHLPLDRWFESSPRTAGCILAVAALILTINSTIVLLGRH